MPSNRASSASPVKFRRGGYGLPQVGGGSVGGGVVGRSVGMTFCSGDTPANDTRLLRPEKMFTILKKLKHICGLDHNMFCSYSIYHQRTMQQQLLILLSYYFVFVFGTLLRCFFIQQLLTRQRISQRCHMPIHCKCARMFAFCLVEKFGKRIKRSKIITKLWRVATDCPLKCSH